MEIDYKTFISLMGIALSAIIGSLAYWYKVRKDIKVKHKRVLYILLEIRYRILLSLFDSKEATEKYIEYYCQRVKLPRKDVPVEILDMIETYFRKIANSLQEDNEKRLIKIYESALDDLSNVDPILTYKLTGKERLEIVFQLSHQYIKEFTTYLNIEHELDKSVQNITLYLNNKKNNTIKLVLDSLNKDIKSLAWKTGMFDYYRCSNIINEGISTENLYDFSELDAEIDSFIHFMQNISE